MKILFEVVIFVLLSFYSTPRILCGALQFERLVSVGGCSWLPTLRKVDKNGQMHYLYSFVQWSEI
nr:hypothetical protein Iba_chr04fCG5210 [Ipomoea batatas]